MSPVACAPTSPSSRATTCPSPACPSPSRSWSGGESDFAAAGYTLKEGSDDDDLAAADAEELDDSDDFSDDYSDEDMD